MFDIFGDISTPLKFFIAFAIVLALIGVTAWLVRRFGANRLGGANARGRQPRLAVIDAATVDGRRRLVLIRRDNTEHLLMIGGPTDLVVEPNIVRAVGAREVARDTRATGPETTARQVPAADYQWPLQPAAEPAPISTPAPAQRYRAAATEEPWLAPEPGARPRPSDSLTGLAAELSTRLNPPDLSQQRGEPMPRASASPAIMHEPASPPQNDHNLAEMAQQLEAALRRAPDGRPPVSDPLAAQASPQNKGEPRAPMRDYKPRQEPKLEPKFESKPEPKFDAQFEPKFDSKPAPRNEPPTTPGRKLYENLEEEMASLLGRPSGKS